MSELNLVLTFAFLFFILAAGPSLFIIKAGANSVGLAIQNFFAMSLWTDPIMNSGFVESWTVFYWAWWVAYAPFVGLFVARISHGRSIKQLIFGMLAFGTLGAWVFFIIVGNYALNLQLTEQLNVISMISKSGEASTIVQIIMTLPWGKLALCLFTLSSFVFLVTTYDSASYTLASVTTKKLKEGQDPSRLNRLFWAGALGIVPIALMYVEGGLKVILSATIVASFPILILCGLLMYSLVKMLQEDERNERELGLVVDEDSVCEESTNDTPGTRQKTSLQAR